MLLSIPFDSDSINYGGSLQYPQYPQGMLISEAWHCLLHQFCPHLIFVQECVLCSYPPPFTTTTPLPSSPNQITGPAVAVPTTRHICVIHHHAPSGNNNTLIISSDFNAVTANTNTNSPYLQCSPEPDLLVGNWGFRPGVTRAKQGFWAGVGNFFSF